MGFPDRLFEGAAHLFHLNRHSTEANSARAAVATPVVDIRQVIAQDILARAGVHGRERYLGQLNHMLFTGRTPDQAWVLESEDRVLNAAWDNLSGDAVTREILFGNYRNRIGGNARTEERLTDRYNAMNLRVIEFAKREGIPLDSLASPLQFELQVREVAPARVVHREKPKPIIHMDAKPKDPVKPPKRVKIPKRLRDHTVIAAQPRQLDPMERDEVITWFSRVEERSRHVGGRSTWGDTDDSEVRRMVRPEQFVFTVSVGRGNSVTAPNYQEWAGAMDRVYDPTVRRYSAETWDSLCRVAQKGITSAENVTEGVVPGQYRVQVDDELVMTISVNGQIIKFLDVELEWR